MTNRMMAITAMNLAISNENSIKSALFANDDTEHLFSKLSHYDDDVFHHHHHHRRHHRFFSNVLIVEEIEILSESVGHHAFFGLTCDDHPHLSHRLDFDLFCCYYVLLT